MEEGGEGEGEGEEGEDGGGVLPGSSGHAEEEGHEEAGDDEVEEVEGVGEGAEPDEPGVEEG